MMTTGEEGKGERKGKEERRKIGRGRRKREGEKGAGDEEGGRRR